MRVRILRVLGINSSAPQVLAFVDGFRVEWRPSTGWRCGCGRFGCGHLAEVRGQIDPRITGDPTDDEWLAE